MEYNVALKNIKRMKQHYEAFAALEFTLNTVVAAEATLNELRRGIKESRRDIERFNKLADSTRNEVESKNNKLKQTYKAKVTEAERGFSELERERVKCSP